MQALSALDVALWDVLGRQAGLPIFRLLGAAQTRLQTIIIGGYYEEGKGTAGLIEEIQSYQEAGYAGVKFKVGGRPPAEDIERVRHVRAAIGSDFIIACDANMGYTVADAITFARGVADCNIAWFEEPVHWYDQIRGMREVRAATGIRVTAGQSEMHRWGCRDLVEGGAVDILNTDLSLAGGVTEWRRVAAHASSHRVLHGPPRGTAVSHAPARLDVAGAVPRVFFGRTRPGRRAPPYYGTAYAQGLDRTARGSGVRYRSGRGLRHPVSR